jgi:transcriptional regulator with XRE-family HTH domain
MAKKPSPDQIMPTLRARFEASGLTLHDLGLKMGYPPDSARKSAWQFLEKTDDPRLSMLRRFAKAMGVDVKELL